MGFFNNIGASLEDEIFSRLSLGKKQYDDLPRYQHEYRLTKIKKFKNGKFIIKAKVRFNGEYLDHESIMVIDYATICNGLKKLGKSIDDIAFISIERAYINVVTPVARVSYVYFEYDSRGHNTMQRREFYFGIKKIFHPFKF